MKLSSEHRRCLGVGCDLRSNCLRHLDESYQGERRLVEPEAKEFRGKQICPNQIPRSDYERKPH